MEPAAHRLQALKSPRFTRAWSRVFTCLAGLYCVVVFLRLLRVAGITKEIQAWAGVAAAGLIMMFLALLWGYEVVIALTRGIVWGDGAPIERPSDAGPFWVKVAVKICCLLSAAATIAVAALVAYRLTTRSSGP
jgi:hypothetical protein